jgi:hypothetical protein
MYLGPYGIHPPFTNTSSLSIWALVLAVVVRLVIVVLIALLTVLLMEEEPELVLVGVVIFEVMFGRIK